MKKGLLYTLILAILLTSITGCTSAPNTPSATETPKVTPPPKASGTPGIFYTDEFKYLPKHPGMKLKELKKGQEGNLDYAYYTITDVDFNKFLSQYEDILKYDGWTVTQSQMPTTLAVQKDEHVAAMSFSDTGKEFLLVVTSK